LLHGHERYEELLKKAGVLNEAFVDYRTRAVIRTNAQGQQVVTTDTVTSSTPPAIPDSADEPALELQDDDPTPVVRP
jgi:type III restriction enzyme